MLGFAVTAPFEVSLEGEAYVFPAWLPHFGGEKGMVLLELREGASVFGDPAYKALRKAGFYASSLNPAREREFKEHLFVDALLDWGYFGPGAERPAWLSQPNPWLDKSDLR
jgi:hypothetical protein